MLVELFVGGFRYGSGNWFRPSLVMTCSTVKYGISDSSCAYDPTSSRTASKVPYSRAIKPGDSNSIPYIHRPAPTGRGLSVVSDSQ